MRVCGEPFDTGSAGLSFLYRNGSDAERRTWGRQASLQFDGNNERRQQSVVQTIDMVSFPQGEA